MIFSKTLLLLEQGEVGNL